MRDPKATLAEGAPTTAPVDLAVSIVTYRTPDLLAGCLDALDRARDDLTLAVTVTDNAAEEATEALVRARYPWVRLLRSRENLGFGRAHNAALRHASARHLLVLNSDTAIRPGSITALVRYLDEHPDVAVVGPRLRYPDGRTQPSRRRFPTLLTFFAESTQVQRFWPSNPVARRYYVSDRSDDQEQDVDWLVGACIAVRGAAAAQVGLFDERFFLYSEEIDWCRRFRAAGWRVVYMPEAEVQHLEGGTSRQDLAARDAHFQQSRLRYLEKWHGPRAAALLRTYLILEYIFRATEETSKMLVGSRVAERRERLRVIASTMHSALRA